MILRHKDVCVTRMCVFHAPENSDIEAVCIGELYSLDRAISLKSQRI